MNNNFNCYYDFSDNSYNLICKNRSAQSGSPTDSLISSVQISALSNMQVKDNGYKANQSTEESSGVAECINPNDEHILQLTKAIINQDSYKAFGIIAAITQPILLHEKIYLEALAEYNDLSEVENLISKVFKYSPPVSTSSRRRGAG